MVVLFDGVCNLCNGFVRFLLKRDKQRLFQFASLQSIYGIGLANHFNISLTGPETIVLYDKGEITTQSDAVIKIISSLGGIWKGIVIVKIIPRFIRNNIYRLLARNRYKLFGKKDQCEVPPEGTENRFLDNTPFSQ